MIHSKHTNWPENDTWSLIPYFWTNIPRIKRCKWPRWRSIAREITVFQLNDVSLVLEDTVQRNSHGCDQEGYQQRYIYIYIYRYTDITLWLTVSLGTRRGVFCRPRWQILFAHLIRSLTAHLYRKLSGISDVISFSKHGAYCGQRHRHLHMKLLKNKKIKIKRKQNPRLFFSPSFALPITEELYVCDVFMYVCMYSWTKLFQFFPM